MHKPLDFEKYAMKGNEFLNRLAENLGDENRARAARILRSTFRVLRNHLSVEESFQLVSQMPMALKSIYVDGWKLSDHRRIKTIDDMVVEIIQEEGKSASRDFAKKDEIIEALRAVIDTLKEYTSVEEVNQALGTLPKKIQAIFEPTTTG